MTELLDECRKRWPCYKWLGFADRRTDVAICEELGLRVVFWRRHTYTASVHDMSGHGDNLDDAVDALRANTFGLIKALARVRRVLEGKPTEATVDKLFDAIFEPDATTEDDVRAEYAEDGLDYDAAAAKVLATLDRIDMEQRGDLAVKPDEVTVDEVRVGDGLDYDAEWVLATFGPPGGEQPESVAEPAEVPWRSAPPTVAEILAHRASGSCLFMALDAGDPDDPACQFAWPVLVDAWDVDGAARFLVQSRIGKHGERFDLEPHQRWRALSVHGVPVPWPTVEGGGP